MLPIMPYNLMFILFLALGSVMAISSSQWVYVWLGLEINLFSFIPLMTHSSNNQEIESALKYFLTQAAGSGLLLLGASTLINFSTSMSLSFMLMISGLMIKLGLAPFHFWLPQVMNGLSWPLCLILATWQKLAPISLLLKLLTPQNFNAIAVIASLSALTGGLGGMNQTQLRPLLAYSSIGHMGWMTATMLVSSKMTLLYFMIYVLISICLMSSIMISSMTSTSINISSLSSSLLNNLCIATLLLSLGGIPPLLGFLPKWVVLSSLISSTLSITAFLLIMGSLMNLFYYLNIFMNLLMSSNPHNPNHFKAPKTSSSLLILGTMTLPAAQSILLYALTFLYKP